MAFGPKNNFSVPVARDKMDEIAFNAMMARGLTEAQEDAQEDTDIFWELPKVGIALFRNGKPVSQVAWDLGFIDSWIGHYILMVRQVPYAPWDDEDLFVVCRVSRDVLRDVAELLIQRRFYVCKEVYDYFQGCAVETSDAVRVGIQLEELIGQFQDGDEFRYYSNE